MQLLQFRYLHMLMLLEFAAEVMVSLDLGDGQLDCPELQVCWCCDRWLVELPSTRHGLYQACPCITCL